MKKLLGACYLAAALCAAAPGEARAEEAQANPPSPDPAGGSALAPAAADGQVQPAAAGAESAAGTFGELEADPALGGGSLDFLQYVDLMVVSPSRQPESIDEVPVPITVITSEMLRLSGVRSLREALLTFVPGMTPIEDHNEWLVGVRGVYATTNSKMLILVDGIRLNSRVLLDANPDYGIDISPDRIKQIEVMRGPGSAVFGNAALTSVVNIVTQDAERIDGAHAAIGGGNHGQRRANFSYGKRFSDSHKLVLWGQYFSAEGESVELTPQESFSTGGTTYLSRFTGPGAYDVGLKYSFGEFQLQVMRQLSHYTEPFSANSAGGVPAGQTYDLEKFRTFMENEPGQTSYSNHFALKYGHEFSESFSVEGNAYYDTNSLLVAAIANPAGIHRLLNTQEQSFGLVASVRYDYKAGAWGRGNAIGGVQSEVATYTDSLYIEGVGGEWTSFKDSAANRMVTPGTEATHSLFAQVKHYFLDDRVILNAGLRFDYKDRANSEDISDLSPRLAVIAKASEELNLKLSYSQSFVDAAYWYRYNSSPDYRGASSLSPEHLRSIQFTPTVTLLGGKLVSASNVFFNDLTDIVYKNPAAKEGEPLYQNSGQLRSIGVEEELSWLRDWYRLRGNLTWQRVLDSKDYVARDGRIFNVPFLVANLNADVNPVQKLFPGKKVWLNAGLRFIGERLSPVNVKFTDAAGTQFEYVAPDNELPAVALLNLGLHLDDIGLEGLGFDATVHNVLGTRYFQGGSVPHPYPQEGRWVWAAVRYHFDR